MFNYDTDLLLSITEGKQISILLQALKGLLRTVKTFTRGLSL